MNAPKTDATASEGEDMTEDTQTPELPLERVPDALPAIVTLQPMELIAQAIQAGTDPAALVTLSELAKEWEDRSARKEYAAALGMFQQRCPAIRKTREGPKATHAGSGAMYSYAPLEEITRTVDPILQDLGLAYSWDSTIVEGMMVVTCTLRHTNGHAESASFTCPCDSKSPAMSNQQKFGGAMTYARRYSLTAILGITTADDDVDGSDAEMMEFVTDDQAAELQDLAESPNVDTDAFLKWVGAESFFGIRAGQYEAAKNALKRKAGVA